MWKAGFWHTTGSKESEAGAMTCTRGQDSGTPACLSHVAGNYTGGGKRGGKVTERKSDGNQEGDKRCSSHERTIPPSPGRVCSRATRIVELTFLMFRNTSAPQLSLVYRVRLWKEEGTRFTSVKVETGSIKPAPMGRLDHPKHPAARQKVSGGFCIYWEDIQH